MDVFIEYMVKRKKSLTDYVKVLATFVIGLALIFVVSVAFAPIPFINSFILLMVAGIIYAMHYIITLMNVEYEYILTNNELDVDAIINKKRRKRLTTANLRQIECWGRKSDKGFENYFNNKSIKKFFACKDLKEADTCFIVYYNNDDKNMLLYNPNEKILKRIEILNPQRGM